MSTRQVTGMRLFADSFHIQPSAVCAPLQKTQVGEFSERQSANACPRTAKGEFAVERSPRRCQATKRRRSINRWWTLHIGGGCSVRRLNVLLADLHGPLTSFILSQWQKRLWRPYLELLLRRVTPGVPADTPVDPRNRRYVKMLYDSCVQPNRSREATRRMLKAFKAVYECARFQLAEVCYDGRRVDVRDVHLELQNDDGEWYTLRFDGACMEQHVRFPDWRWYFGRPARARLAFTCRDGRWPLFLACMSSESTQWLAVPHCLLVRMAGCDLFLRTSDGLVRVHNVLEWSVKILCSLSDEPSKSVRNLLGHRRCVRTEPAREITVAGVTASSQPKGESETRQGGWSPAGMANISVTA